MQQDVLGKFHADNFRIFIFEVESGEAAVEANAMLQVNEGVALGEFGKVEHLIDLRAVGRRFACIGCASARRGAEVFRCCQQGDAFCRGH